MLHWGLDEQARHEHMSDEYKDRYIIIALLKTLLGITDNTRTPQWFPPNGNQQRTRLEASKPSTVFTTALTFYNLAAGNVNRPSTKL